jgi:formylglycine-generating enzyme required for sulfatase activity
MAGVLHQQGTEKVDALVSAILDTLDGKATLAAQVRCAGLLGAIVSDLKPLRYQVADSRYEALMASVLAIFDKDQAETVPLEARLEAAEALGQAGDPRIGHDNWVPIEAGTFVMGEPLRRVELEAFEIGRYPVTVEEYARFVEDDGYLDERWWREGGFGRWNEPWVWELQKQHPNWPVVGVSWYEASAYCAWKRVRLPREAEWERAARGVSGRLYPWGDEEPDATRANFGMKVADPTPVGLYPRGATPEGVQDMAGNVWEWVADWYEEGRSRVLRGGSWGSYLPGFVRASGRGRGGPGDRSRGIGFRCARE